MISLAATLFVLASLLPGIPAALAQTPANAGVPQGSASDSLVVDATDPVLFECRRSSQGGCFRIYFEIKPSRANAVLVAFIGTRSQPYETQAFAGTGATCEARVLGGLPDASHYTNGDVRWDEQPFEVTASKPATYMLEFECDGRLVAGDQVTIQITLAADPTRRGEQIVRYVFPRLGVVAGR